jgi:hypothetical protein
LDISCEEISETCNEFDLKSTPQAFTEVGDHQQQKQ